MKFKKARAKLFVDGMLTSINTIVDIATFLDLKTLKKTRIYFSVTNRTLGQKKGLLLDEVTLCSEVKSRGIFLHIYATDPDTILKKIEDKEETGDKCLATV